jgi:hypothetical protein
MPRRHLTAGTFLCHNCLRTFRQKCLLRRIRHTKERKQKAPPNKQTNKQTSHTVHMQCIPTYATSPSPALLYCPSQFIVSPPRSLNSRPVYCPSFVHVLAAASISVIQTEHIRYTWFSSGPQTIISQLMYINKQRCTNLPLFRWLVLKFLYGARTLEDDGSRFYRNV